MIYVPKPKRMAPPDFLAKARAEMEAVVPLFSRPHHKPPKYKYKAYRTPTLVAVLEKLFQGKCAYCEAIYADTGYVEVEHYRPKKIYYWLAADWTNLLPSCKKCNNGKMSKFPLMNSAQQAARRGVEKREQPLLLNPSDPAPARRPEKHLRFNPADGAISAALIHGQESPIGATSIKVYRLSRKELSDRRRDWATRVQGAIVSASSRRKPARRQYIGRLPSRASAMSWPRLNPFARSLSKFCGRMGFANA